jgi:catechol 2,3-dioxygenase-like lactoylglutathione lyase family enzyme
VQLRVARHTDRPQEVVAFYRDGLGLRELGAYGAEHGLTFEDPDGFRVVLVPDAWEA